MLTLVKHFLRIFQTVRVIRLKLGRRRIVLLNLLQHFWMSAIRRVPVMQVLTLIYIALVVAGDTGSSKLVHLTFDLLVRH